MSVAVAIGAGILLIVLETILPGMIAGTCGVILMGMGVFLSYRDYGVEVGTWVLGGSTAALLIFTMIWIAYFPKTFFAKIFVSERTIGGDVGEELSPDLTGQSGTAVTRLYSCGKIKIGNKILDAITSGEGIEKDAPVRIIRVEGMKIVVEEVKK